MKKFLSEGLEERRLRMENKINELDVYNKKLIALNRNLSELKNFKNLKSNSVNGLNLLDDLKSSSGQIQTILNESYQSELNDDSDIILSNVINNDRSNVGDKDIDNDYDILPFESQRQCSPMTVKDSNGMLTFIQSFNYGDNENHIDIEYKRPDSITIKIKDRFIIFLTLFLNSDVISIKRVNVLLFDEANDKPLYAISDYECCRSLTVTLTNTLQYNNNFSYIFNYLLSYKNTFLKKPCHGCKSILNFKLDFLPPTLNTYIISKNNQKVELVTFHQSCYQSKFKQQ